MALQLNKVLISDSVDKSCREILEGDGISVEYKPGIAKDELLTIIKVQFLVQIELQGLQGFLCSF